MINSTLIRFSPINGTVIRFRKLYRIINISVFCSGAPGHNDMVLNFVNIGGNDLIRNPILKQTIGAAAFFNRRLVVLDFPPNTGWNSYNIKFHGLLSTGILVQRFSGSAKIDIVLEVTD